MNLFITADKIGIETGGGIVTHKEKEALSELGDDVTVITLTDEERGKDPFTQDNIMCERARDLYYSIYPDKPKLAHCYAGCLGETVKFLKSVGTKVTYTTAAHDKDESRREYERLGIPFSYPHLIEPRLWAKYIEGYMASDVLIVPSTMSAAVKRVYGRKGPIAIIPHGTDIPEEMPHPYPIEFTIGYLGAIGPDKGLIYLLQAWKELNYTKQQVKGKLIVAGKYTDSIYMYDMINKYGGGNISVLGWQNHVSDFYNQISVYVQPSVTEGFGIEVLEAMAYGRPVLCSRGAGAADLVPEENRFYARDIISLKKAILLEKDTVNDQNTWKEIASKYTWEIVKERYKALWRKLV